MDIKSEVRAFVRDNFYVDDDGALTDGASLLDLGIVDSTGILEIIMFLESAFDVLVEDAEIIPENLDSIDAIAAFVTRKRSKQLTAEAS